MQMKIIIDKDRYRPVSWNKIYESRHWATRKHIVDLIHLLTKEAAYKALRTQPLPSGVVDIHIDVFFDKRPYDSSNIPIKIFEDALKGIVIKDDTIKYVRRVSSQSHIDKLRPRVEIILTEII